MALGKGVRHERFGVAMAYAVVGLEPFDELQHAAGGRFDLGEGSHCGKRQACQPVAMWLN